MTMEAANALARVLGSNVGGNELQIDDERLDRRFWKKVSPEPNTGCWIWVASTTKGYGKVGRRGRYRYAHRVSYEAWRGPIPPGLVIDHLCRQPLCVNPLHLEPVTQRVNVMRSGSVSAVNAKKTHCKQGHAFDERNTYTWKSGRSCRECHRLSEARRKSKLRLLAEHRDEAGRECEGSGVRL